MSLRPLIPESPRTAKQWATTGRSLGKEIGASVLSYQMYPLGFLGTSLPVLSHPIRKPYPQKRPILFIHGIFHNRSTFTYLIQRLRWTGWKHSKEVNFPTGFRSIRVLAEKTKHHVELLKREYQVDSIDIVAHSMGGIVARYYIQCLGGDSSVKHLITLGTPHSGTNLSRFGFLPQVRELRPKSETIQRLKQASPPEHTQILSIFGELDFMIFPRKNAWWNGVRNVPLADIGHAGVLFSDRVYQLITSRLRN